MNFETLKKKLYDYRVFFGIIYGISWGISIGSGVHIFLVSDVKHPFLIPFCIVTCILGILVSLIAFCFHYKMEEKIFLSAKENGIEEVLPRLKRKTLLLGLAYAVVGAVCWLSIIEFIAYFKEIVGLGY